MRFLPLLLVSVLAAVSIAVSDRSQSFVLNTKTVQPTHATKPSPTPAQATPAAALADNQMLLFAQTSQTGKSRGYLTTPEELTEIKQKAEEKIQPYEDAVRAVLTWAKRKWDYNPDKNEKCKSADRPTWLDNQRGIPRLYARALAAHLVADQETAEEYAEETKQILERIMSDVETISLSEQQCQLNFAWNIPEVVAAADLIEAYWHDQTCTGPLHTLYGENEIGKGPCKVLFQNWLVKNPYYIVSYAAVSSQSNWGAAGTNATAYIADYLWDRPDVLLIHRNPKQLHDGRDIVFTPAEAYAYANQLMFDRMNGYGIDYHSSSACDLFEGAQQNKKWPMVKSQITPDGIIPEDARRDEFCNIERYDGSYQNYPQVHLGSNIQQCELMLRRGDSSCYDNIDNTEIAQYAFTSPKGVLQTTTLSAGRGSIERAIKAIIVDSDTEWRHYSALEVAYRYYYQYHTLDGFEQWSAYLGRVNDCGQDVCFGVLTHGFAPDETPKLPPSIVAPLPANANTR